MKRFVWELGVFIIISLMATYTVGVLIDTFIYRTGHNVLNEADFVIHEVTIKSARKFKTKHLVIGESVGHQLYGDCSDSVVYCLSSSASIMDVGNYLLLAKYLEVNKDNLPEDVIFIYHPFAWNLTITGGLAYSAFVKNFYNNTYIKYMDDKLVQHIKKFPLAELCKFKAYQYSPYSPDVSEVTQENGVSITPMQYEYLKKIEHLCKKNGVNLRLLSGPLRRSRCVDADRVKKSNMIFEEEIFDGYFDSLVYFDDDCFVDDSHLKKECIPSDFLSLYE